MTNDQLAKWTNAEAASRRQQRNQRGRRKRGLAAVSGAGMVRLQSRYAGVGTRTGGVRSMPTAGACGAMPGVEGRK